MTIDNINYNPAEVIANHEEGVNEELDVRYGRAWFDGRDVVLRSAIIQRMSEIISVCGMGKLPDLERKRNSPMSLEVRESLEREIKNITALIDLARKRRNELEHGGDLCRIRKIFLVREEKQK